MRENKREKSLENVSCLEENATMDALRKDVQGENTRESVKEMSCLEENVITFLYKRMREVVHLRVMTMSASGSSSRLSSTATVEPVDARSCDLKFFIRSGRNLCDSSMISSHRCCSSAPSGVIKMVALRMHLLGTFPCAPAAFPAASYLSSKLSAENFSGLMFSFSPSFQYLSARLT